MEYRAFNAYGNNIENPEWVIPGAVNIRETPYTNYADGVGEINTNLVPVREISNILFSQEPDVCFFLFILFYFTYKLLTSPHHFNNNNNNNRLIIST